MASSSSAACCASDRIYTSPRPPITFPTDPSHSAAPFLFRRARAHASRTALVDAITGRSLTFAELERSIRHLALALRHRLCVCRGDVVLLCAPNSVDYALVFLAALSLGAVPTTVNPACTVREVAKQAEDSRPKLVFTVPQIWGRVRGLRLPAIFIGSTAGQAQGEQEESGITWLSHLLAMASEDDRYRHDWLERDPPPVGQSDVAALLYSSGTTGTGKGVVLTHRNFMAAALMRASTQDADGDPPHVFLGFLPMFHTFGLCVITYCQLYRGNTVVIMPRFDMDQMLRAIERYRVTQLPTVPPVMLALAKQGKVTRYDLSSLRRLGCGAAPLGKDVMEEVSRLFPQADVCQVIFSNPCNPDDGWLDSWFGRHNYLNPAIATYAVSVYIELQMS